MKSAIKQGIDLVEHYRDILNAPSLEHLAVLTYLSNRIYSGEIEYTDIGVAALFKPGTAETVAYIMPFLESSYVDSKRISAELFFLQRIDQAALKFRITSLIIKFTEIENQANHGTI